MHMHILAASSLFVGRRKWSLVFVTSWSSQRTQEVKELTRTLPAVTWKGPSQICLALRLDDQPQEWI